MRVLSLLAATLASACLWSAPAQAESEFPLVQQARTSKLLFDLGQARRDPLLVLAAASLRRSIDLAPAERMAKNGQEGGNLLTWQAMADTARRLAAGDPAMIALIEDMEAANTKGVVSGPVYNIATISAKREDIYDAIPFDGRVYAEVYVEGRGPENLDLFIRDAQGRLVCSDTDASAIAYCGWTPREQGSFSITVVNASNSSSTYSLITN